ncbi:MAG: adenylosuccinate lyase, partial [Nitrosospira sp.]|nr:adenylosuccinate lyase [Nitrosospira sp.]
MNLSPLTALSPLDGRYHGKVSALRPYFSEYALIRYRVQIEIEWFKALSQEPEISEVSVFSAKVVEYLDDLVTNFSEADAEAVKAIEGRTNHDVKAIEYWLKQRLMQNAEIIA